MEGHENHSNAPVEGQLVRTLEDRVAERSRQLAELDRELELFSYCVSHDLQAPLRHITAYSELILEKADVFDEETRSWLGRIRSSADTMTHMLHAMLKLASYLRVELLPVPVDLTALAHEQAELLRGEDPSRKVEFTIADDLRVQADESLLRVVMQNLMGNAWKFTARRELARIEVGSVRQPDGSVAYFVRDNGAGFDMRYMKKLFAPFQRMHAAKDFPGTGVGLAAAKRILHRHGGSIWADAEIERGATFFFTLKESGPGREPSAMWDGDQPAPDRP